MNETTTSVRRRTPTMSARYGLVRVRSQRYEQERVSQQTSGGGTVGIIEAYTSTLASYEDLLKDRVILKLYHGSIDDSVGDMLPQCGLALLHSLRQLGG